MWTTRSDMVLASRFSSIILSNPKALVEPRIPLFAIDLLRELTDEEDECVEPSRLGVGVVERERGVSPPCCSMGRRDGIFA